ELQEYGITPLVVDPQADAEEANRLYGITFRQLSDIKEMDAVIVAVSHREFLSWKKEDLDAFFAKNGKTKVLMDLKGMYQMQDYPSPEYSYWRL
ncbi:MAG: nucleotide sugar dehydrogenase, partial [Lachnospiraceae bacterium]|nr:nucleotide sugar dehydrogenase [Lachnospiraceae bacterium]